MPTLNGVSNNLEWNRNQKRMKGNFWHVTIEMKDVVVKVWHDLFWPCAPGSVNWTSTCSHRRPSCREVDLYSTFYTVKSNTIKEVWVADFTDKIKTRYSYVAWRNGRSSPFIINLRRNRLWKILPTQCNIGERRRNIKSVMEVLDLSIETQGPLILEWIRQGEITDCDCSKDRQQSESLDCGWANGGTWPR